MSRSAEQTAMLEQLWAVTASESDAARERDERLLRENGWDVQVTIEQIFNLGSQPAAAASSSAPSQRSSRMEQMDFDDSLTSVRPPPGSRRLSGSSRGVPRGSAGTSGAGLGLFGILAWPVGMVVSVLSGAWYLFIRTFIPLSFLPHLPRFLLPPSGPPSSRLGTSSSRPAYQDPTTSALAFIRDLETSTSCSAAAGTLPDFYVGPYREFLTHLRREGKVGCAVLVCGEHEDDEQFKREVLCDAEFVRCVKERDIVCWIADIRSREGYQVAQTLQITTYPSLTFFSLLPPPPTASSTTPRLTILTTLSGPPSTTTSSASLLQLITTSVLPRTAPFLSRLKRERLSLAEARHLREEQDRAFRAAERRDREKMEERKKLELAEKAKRDREAREQREREERVVKRQVWRRYARKHLLPPSEGPIRVAMRTPFSSERHVRHFQPSDATTRPLFVFAETLLIPKEDAEADDPDSPPDDGDGAYEPDWDFRIVTSYPRREIQRVEEGGAPGAGSGDAKKEWEVVRGAGGALFAEKTEGSAWGEAEFGGDASSDEEAASDED